MCAVSAVMDHYHDSWYKRIVPTPYIPSDMIEPYPINIEPPITDQEIRDFRDLYNRMKEYDAKTGQPDCELESKKQAVLDLAEQLGIKDKINFL